MLRKHVIYEYSKYKIGFDIKSKDIATKIIRF